MDTANRRSRMVESRNQTDSIYAPRQSTYEPLNPEDDPFSPPNYSTNDTLYHTQGQPYGGNHDGYPPANTTSTYDPPPGNPRTEPVKMGDEETDASRGWDVYADFNNTGPRYSGAGNLGAALAVTTREGCVRSLHFSYILPLILSSLLSD